MSSRDLVQESLTKIDRLEARIGAFISRADPEDLLSTASHIDDLRAKGEEVHPLAGIPVAVKDNIAVRGMEMTCGSRILEGYRPPYDATAVGRLRDAGLIIVGKTNMDEFGFGSSTENSAFHTTRNPANLDMVPGGSSGGSAAAVAAGIVPWALGTDTGGSIRQPAALCGVAGFRPTFGSVSRYGLVSYASSMDQIGPLAKSVDDAAALLSVIAGPDPRDSTCFPHHLGQVDQIPGTLRVGVPQEYLSDACQPAVTKAIADVSEHLSALGWKVTPVSLPLTEYALSIYYIIASVEAASNLARYDGVKYGYSLPDTDTWEEMLIGTRTKGFGDEAKRRIILGTFASSAGYQDQYYARACNARELLSAEFRRAFENVDLLLTPISPTTAWRLGEKTTDPIQMYLSDVFSIPAALAGIPASVIPVGADAEGLPVGVQLCGPPGADSLVLAASRVVESLTVAE